MASVWGPGVAGEEDGEGGGRRQALQVRGRGPTCGGEGEWKCEGCQGVPTWLQAGCRHSRWQSSAVIEDGGRPFHYWAAGLFNTGSPSSSPSPTHPLPESTHFTALLEALVRTRRPLCRWSGTTTAAACCGTCGTRPPSRGGGAGEACKDTLSIPKPVIVALVCAAAWVLITGTGYRLMSL